MAIGSASGTVVSIGPHADAGGYCGPTAEGSAAAAGEAEESRPKLPR